MKTEELTALGLTAEQAQQVLAMNGRDIEKHKNEAAALRVQLDTATGQLSEASKKLEGFDPDWKSKAEKAQADAAAQVAALRLDYAIDAGIARAKGRNTRAIRALVNRDDLKLATDGSVVGLDAQLDSIRKDNAYLFEDEKPAPSFAASATGTAPTTNPDKKAVANEAFRSLFKKE